SDGHAIEPVVSNRSDHDVLGQLGIESRSSHAREELTMDRRALLVFHIAMGATYLGVVGAELAHQFAIRNALICAGAGFWLTGVAFFLARKMTRPGILSCKY